jgi:hypothetical protein
MGEASAKSARPSAAEAVAWAISGLLVAWVVAWPWIAGMVAINDDLKFVRVDAPLSPLVDRIAAAWRTEPTFRPLEIAVGMSCDGWTLRPGLAPWLQAVGVIACGAAVVALARRCVPGSRVVAPLALGLFALSPALSVSAWQVDTVSQTWTAAAGCWGLLAAHRAAVRGNGAIPARVPLAALSLLVAFGCVIKETAFGWCAGTAAALAVAAFVGRRSPGWAARCALVLLPCVVIPSALVLARLASGGLGGLAGPDDGARYSAQFGMNLLMNAGLSVGALAGNGPFHLLTDDAANPLLRSLPVVAVLAALGLSSAVALLAIVNRRAAAGVRWDLLALAGVAAAGSLAVTLPMGTVGELYGMGANAVAAVAMAAVARSAWRPVADDEVLLGRLACVAGVAILLAVGVVGLAGRAEAFASTWRTADEMNGRIVEAVRDAERDGHDLVVFFALPCFQGRTYGQYVTPPLQAIDPLRSSGWIDAMTPGCEVLLTPSNAPAELGPGRLLIDCAGSAR